MSNETLATESRSRTHSNAGRCPRSSILAKLNAVVVYRRNNSHKMKALIFLISLLAFIPSARAQQIDLIANTDGRKTISLDGQWRTIIDPYETGYYDYRYQPSANGYFKDAKPKTKSDLIEYDLHTSESLTVPGDWNTQRERLLFYEGTIWYN